MINPYEVPLYSPKYRAYMFVMSKIHDLKLKSRFYPDEYTRQVNLEIDVIRKQLLAFCLHTMPCDDFAAEESARRYPRFDGSKWIAPSDESVPSVTSEGDRHASQD